MPFARPTALMFLAVAGSLLAGAVSEAAPCPATVPPGSAERRALARSWFSDGEAAERLADDLGAIRAYRCSMTMVPHASTAYNLALVAEHAGDLELALEANHQYLTLRPEAEDRAAVEQRIQGLQERIAIARQARPVERTAEVPPAQAPPSPAPPQVAAAASPPAVIALPPAAAEGSAAVAPAKSPLARRLWIATAAGGVSLAGAVVLNLVARSQMNECRARNAAGDLAAAHRSCEAARPSAYASYALFAGAGAAAAADVLLLLLDHHQGKELALTPLPGGGLLSLARRF
jgi:hypothetical protein